MVRPRLVDRTARYNWQRQADPCANILLLRSAQTGQRAAQPGDHRHPHL